MKDKKGTRNVELLYLQVKNMQRGDMKRSLCDIAAMRDGCHQTIAASCFVD
jgi:hypothetical protein